MTLPQSAVTVAVTVLFFVLLRGRRRSRRLLAGVDGLRRLESTQPAREHHAANGQAETEPAGANRTSRAAHDGEPAGAGPETGLDRVLETLLTGVGGHLGRTAGAARAASTVVSARSV